MNDSTIQPGATQPAATQVVPVATQVEALTPEQAKTRLGELIHDKEFGAKYIEAKPGSAERNLFDALQRRSLELSAAETTPATTLDPVLDAPTRVEDYKVEDPLGRPIAMDPESEKTVHETLLPAARRLGISQVDLNMITAAVQRPMTEEHCIQSLQRVWGQDYDRAIEDFDKAVTDPKI